MEENMTNAETAKFSLGRVVATPGALAALDEAKESALGFLCRHQSGDWGDVPPEDQEENDLSLESGFRVLSSYKLRDETKIWIITEADRSATTILLPDEY
jgi:hypothetical protein